MTIPGIPNMLKCLSGWAAHSIPTGSICPASIECCIFAICLLLARRKQCKCLLCASHHSGEDGRSRKGPAGSPAMGEHSGENQTEGIEIDRRRVGTIIFGKPLLREGALRVGIRPILVSDNPIVEPRYIRIARSSSLLDPGILWLPDFISSIARFRSNLLWVPVLHRSRETVVGTPCFAKRNMRL